MSAILRGFKVGQNKTKINVKLKKLKNRVYACLYIIEIIAN